MSRTLKKYNGRGHGKYDKGHIYVAAYSMKHAAEIVSKACNTYVSDREIKIYYSNCWGNPMNGIEPESPGLWVSENNLSSEVPKKII